MAILALFSGMAVSAGTFAFLLVIGVFPRMLGKSHLAGRILRIENLIILGVITGAVFSVFPWTFPWAGSRNMILTAAQILIRSVYGISAGFFVGCIAAALAEILHTFPIVFRRTHTKRGLAWVMAAMALGKTCGGLFYFLFQYGP
jgi:stage V sporulation protein AB